MRVAIFLLFHVRGDEGARLFHHTSVCFERIMTRKNETFCFVCRQEHIGNTGTQRKVDEEQVHVRQNSERTERRAKTYQIE